jgi:hypothetical protein
VQEHATHIVVKMHNTFEKHDNVHRDVIYPRLSLDTSLGLETIVPFNKRLTLYISKEGVLVFGSRLD